MQEFWVKQNQWKQVISRTPSINADQYCDIDPNADQYQSLQINAERQWLALRAISDQCQYFDRHWSALGIDWGSPESDSLGSISACVGLIFMCWSPVETKITTVISTVICCMQLLVIQCNIIIFSIILSLRTAFKILVKPKRIICKDLGHFWLGYIRMLGHLQLSAGSPTKFWDALRF